MSGSTGMAPVLRTWLHLYHEDPDVGRVGRGYPGIRQESLTVLAFRLDEDVDRQSVKDALIARLSRAGRLGSCYIGPGPAPVTVAETSPTGEGKVAQVTAEILAGLPG
ncbi:hypothetical protein [Leekyejoonella antrihumi]|uniref:Uncharacterized protein n=1 Tax=Leekyejoonella antrihumi TaxID=1660198 RepID=A0A563DS88_9MICO|nr:hypothetical protein [Leekyejoonella antrihumi]TWP32843.1 hypothetical protein FGL98_23220 [Leekyejoonella antrihumi]